MGMLDWLGLRVRETPPPSDPSTASLIPSRVAAPGAVGSREALSLSMVYRAIQIHAVAVKQLSLDTYRDSQIIGSPLFMRAPEIDMPRSAFLEAAVVSLACAGNAYWRIHRDSETGKLLRLEPLNPHDVVIEHTSAGRVTGYNYMGTKFKPEQIKHLKLLRVPGDVYGLGPIQAAQRELRGAIDLSAYSSNWFQESGVPTGVLKSDQVLSADQAKAARDAWEKSQGARRGVAVLGNGLSYSPVFLSPRDAQFLESQEFNVTEIARLFGVPASLMLANVKGSTDTYQNVSQDWLGYVRFSLMAYLIEIEDALTSLLPRGQRAKFNVEALLRSDITTRYGAHKLALEGGFMTIAEVREIENLPPLEPAQEEPTDD